MRLSLRTKIVLLIVGTATGLASIASLSLVLLANREIAHSVKNDVRVTGGVLAQSLQERSLTLTDQCLLLAKQRVLAAVIITNDPATVAERARAYQQQFHADAVLITGRDGRTLAATDAEATDGVTDGVNVAQEPGIQAALGGHAWTGVVARQGRLMLSVSVPVFIGQYVWGTFTAYRAIDPGLARSLCATLGTEVAFIYRGQVVGASLPLPTRLPTPRDAPRLITLGGVRYFALYAPLPNTQPQDGMGFVTLRPYDRAMAFYRHLQAGLMIVTALMLLFALVAGTTLARGLTRPLESVVQAAHRLKQGEWPEWFEVSRQDEIGLLQSVFNEMTVSLRQNQEHLLTLIDTDPLTGLDNHRRFQERLTQEAARCRRSGESLSLLLLDLDHFQQYNQQHGHACGDEALQQVAQTLRDTLPDVAILSRYGGEEFAALLPQQGLSQAEEFAEQIRRATGPAFTLSVGLAEFGTHTAEAEGLTLAAELALSRAKQLGRNRVCRFDTVPGADQTADPYQLHRFLKDESLATIQALAAAVDAKDPYTRGHSQSVAQYAVSLARFLNLSQPQTDLIHMAGTLHDVGKIGVPDAILKKPGRLTDEERAVMETHPALGEVIVRKAPALAAILPGVRHHHERWDGQGYPDRLVGEAIPHLARILAIADTFDAMTSDRPYRKGLSVAVACLEIARNAGKQFDPELAPAFVEMIQSEANTVPASLARAA